MNIFDNTLEQAFPQTLPFKLIMEHLETPLPEGKTVKKVILLGYDGFRVDGMNNIIDMEQSAILHVKKLGGLYHTFSGGVQGTETEQKTSTAQSWAAMLTGGWGVNYNGVLDADQMKAEDVDTFLGKAAKNGKAVSFTASWRVHTAVTYQPDILYAIRNNLQAEYTNQPDDEGTYYKVLSYVAKTEHANKTVMQDPDVIFFTFEHTDHAGHESGFGNQNPKYIEACKKADSWGYDLVKTIESRSTYDTEDWLIIVTTDHGGIDCGHGEQTVEERRTWMAINKPVEINEENLKFALIK